MKKILFILAMIIAMTTLSSCDKIDEKIVDTSQSDITSPSVTIQTQSPKPITSENTTTSETTTTPPTTATTTTNKTTSKTTTAQTTPSETTTAQTTTIINPTSNPSDAIKGVWFSLYDGVINSSGKSETTYRAGLNTAFSTVKNMGINTVFVHVRSHGDAYYPSAYYAWSKNCAGSIGTAPSFDPLKIMIEEAHKQGLSFHAWVNPMRGPSTSDIANYPDSYLIKKWYNDSTKNGKYIIAVNGNYWLNPAYTEVRELINNGIQEIVQNYDVDGIHIDDYFYPTQDASFDAGAYASSGATNLPDWRRSNTSLMVSDIYKTIKLVDSKVLFGVSPAGNRANNYDKSYIDVEKWCSNSGYLDYIIPQLYYGFNETIYGFTKTATYWNSIIKLPTIKLAIGLAPYKVVENSNGFANEKDVLARQIQYSMALSNYNGVAFFSYKYLINTGDSMTVERENLLPLLK